MTTRKKIITVLLVLCVSVMSVFAQEIHKAVSEGDTAKIKAILEKDPQLISARDSYGFTPFQLTILNGHLEIAAYLLKKGADINAKSTNSGMTALMALAVYSRDIDIEICKFLISNGADINTRDLSGRSLLLTAIMMSHKELVSLLLKNGVSLPNKPDEIKKHLHYSVLNNMKGLFEIIIKNGGEIKSQNINDGTLLHSSAAGGSTEIIEMLPVNDLEVNLKNRYGFTALHLAAINGHKEIAEKLISKGADINTSSAMGKSALHYAKDRGHEKIVNLLSEKGADLKQPTFPNLTGEYLGQKKPGFEPVLFAPGIVSSMAHEMCSPAFSPDGTEVYWNSNQRKIWFSKIEKNHWTAPQIASFSTDAGAQNPYFSHDGNKLFFLSYRPLDLDGQQSRENLWFVDKIDNDWSNPKHIGPAVNSKGLHQQFSISQNSTLYFGAKGDLYYSNSDNDDYAVPKKLGETINTDLTEWCAYISPDESYLIFTRVGDEDGFGVGDLYISYRSGEGSWTEAKNLGDVINSSSNESHPSVSLDGKYLFFLSNRNGNGDIYWVDAEIIEKKRPVDIFESVKK